MEMYNEDLEKKILAYCLFSEETLNKIIQQKLESIIYGQLHINFYKICVQMFDKYNVCLTAETLQQYLQSNSIAEDTIEDYKILYAELKGIDLDITALSFYVDQFKGLALKRHLYDVLDRGVKDLDTLEGPKVLDNLLHNVTPLKQTILDDKIAEDFIFNEVDKRKESYLYKKNNPNAIKGLMTGFDQLDQLTNGLYRKELALIVGRTGKGKCFRKGTKIIMYDGCIKNVEDIKQNELLMGDDSTPRTVLSATKGKGKIYKITPTKGKSWYCNEDHILHLVPTQNKQYIRKETYISKKTGNSTVYTKINKIPKQVNISIKDYIVKSNKFKHNFKLKYANIIHFERKQVKIDPYFLGLLLGDGCINHGISICTMDSEIRDYCNEYVKTSFNLNCVLYGNKYHGKAETYGFTNSKTNIGIGRTNKLIDIIRDLNLYIRGDKKFIPEIYKVNSKKIRLHILAGLLDSDGSLNNNCFDITSKSKQMAEDICFVARSLGLFAIMKDSWKCATNTEKKILRKYYRVNISGNIKIIPTKLKRKQATKRKQIKNVLHSGFQVTYVNIDDFYGFEVDKNHLFLLEDFTIVHNSRCLNNIAYNLSTAGESGILFSLEMYMEQLKRLFDSRGAGVSYIDLKKGTLTEKEEEKYFNFLSKIKLSQPPLYLVDYSGDCNPTFIRNIIRERKKHHDIKWVCIDYLTLMSPNGKWLSTPAKYGLLSRELKQIAKAENLTIITASQSNRESLKSKKTELQHVSFSDEISHSCDLIVNLEQNEEQELQHILEMIVLKYRDGESNKKFELFCNWAKSFLGNLQVTIGEEKPDNDLPAQLPENEEKLF